MSFKNEYHMSRRRYIHWTTPVFYRDIAFWVFSGIFVFALAALMYFNQVGAPGRWKTLAMFMMVLSVYRVVFYKVLATDKHYRLLRQQKFNDKDWTVEIIVDDKGVKYKTNGRNASYVKWADIVSFQEAKSFFDLNDSLTQQARLDKECFTKGDADSFREYMLKEHPEIPYGPVDPKINK